MGGIVRPSMLYINRFHEMEDALEGEKNIYSSGALLNRSRLFQKTAENNT